MFNFFRKNSFWLLPIVIILAFAPFSAEVDLGVSTYFYNPESATFSNNAFYQFIFDYGQLPGFLACAVVAILFLTSYKKASLAPLRPYLFAFGLVAFLGPGLITNGILKPAWGRPRPRQVEELGGETPFHSFYKPNFGYYVWDNFKSMPSGHAAMGFLFFSMAVSGHRMRNRKIMITGFLLAIVLGGILGLTRIAQGGHFLSDVLMAALIMWLLAVGVDALVFRKS